METTVHRSIDEIDEEEWDAIVGRNRLICSHGYLRAIERSRINDCRFFYPVIRDRGRIVAHTCLYTISTELDSFAHGMAKRAINAVRSIHPSFLLIHSVEGGTPVALGHTFSFRDENRRAEYLQALVCAAENVARSVNVGTVLFRDFREHELSGFAVLRGLGYRTVSNLQCACLDVRWRSFEQYLDEMRSPYRHKIKEHKRQCAKAGVGFELLRNYEPFSSELSALWRNVYDRASEYRREILQPVFFKNICSELEGRSAVILARRHGRPVGFVLLLLDDDVLEWLFCGLDYSCSKQCGLYFGLMYEIINFAINEEFAEINLGITTIVPKLDLGARAMSLKMYMKHLNPCLNLLIPALFNAMTPKPKPERRHVFQTPRSRRATA